MKRIFALALLLISLSGCSAKSTSMDKLYEFREQLLHSNEVTFESEITADYGQDLYTFQADCAVDESGTLSFEVIKPDTISGVQGNISTEDSYFAIDDQVLVFKPIADERLSPVSAPWVFITALKGGYITSCGKTDTGYLAVIRDTYEENPLILEVRFIEDLPVSAEVFWNQARIITMKITNFHYE